MVNLLAICRRDGSLAVKKVRTTQPVQAKLAGVFSEQAASFFSGIDDEVAFTGAWNPDPNELLCVDAHSEVLKIIEVAGKNVTEIPDVESANFTDERIVGLFVVERNKDSSISRILIQPFSLQQILNKKHSFFLQGNVFTELTEPAFTLAPKLVAVIEGDRLKFKSFINIRKIFDVASIYTEATDEEISKFCEHERVHVEDVAAFKAGADQIVRKLISAISSAGTLTSHDASTIAEKAASFGISIAIKDGKIVFPSERRALKMLCRFLDDAIYQGTLSSLMFQTNSKRVLSS